MFFKDAFMTEGLEVVKPSEYVVLYSYSLVKDKISIITGQWIAINWLSCVEIKAQNIFIEYI